MTAAIAIAKSGNGKIGQVSATYASQESCPTTCTFKGSGCYAESGPTGFTTRRLNRDTVKGPIAIAKQEAAAIRALKGDRPLRVHVVGDCSTNAAAKIVSSAMADYPNVSWTYTHAWRTVDRASWGNASVLASCETAQDVKDANARGYAAAIVRAEPHPSRKVYDVDEIKVLPCPAESSETLTCADCQLCTKDAMLKDRNLTIGFYVHGSGKAKAAAAVNKRTE
jgi:hypothetical protein